MLYVWVCGEGEAKKEDLLDAAADAFFLVYVKKSRIINYTLKIYKIIKIAKSLNSTSPAQLSTHI